MCNDLLNERSLNAILFVWLAVYLWLAVYSEISHCIWKGHSFQVNHRLEQNKQVANFACLYQMHLSANWTRKITRKTKQRTRKICNFPTDVISECSHNFDSLIGSITKQTEVNLLCFFFFLLPRCLSSLLITEVGFVIQFSSVFRAFDVPSFLNLARDTCVINIVFRHDYLYSGERICSVTTFQLKPRGFCSYTPKSLMNMDLYMWRFFGPEMN